MFSQILKSIAPDPPLVLSFEHHWKLVKLFYAAKESTQRHIDDTNLPYQLQKLLQILIQEQDESQMPESHNGHGDVIKKADCINFVLENKPLDFLTDMAVSDKPIGCKSLVLKWMRKYLTCIKNPYIDHGSILKPILKLLSTCKGAKASPYELEEVLFLEALSGIIGKTPEYRQLFIPSHQFSNSSTTGLFQTKLPNNNQLFLAPEPRINGISLIADDETDDVLNNEDSRKRQDPISPSCSKQKLNCNCVADDRFVLLDTIVSYIDSADSEIVVRTCEAILILVANDENNCEAEKTSLASLSTVIADKIIHSAELIPEDMLLEDVSDCNVSWGLFPKDDDDHHFIGQFQLTSFLCWLDFADSVANANRLVATECGKLFREQVLEKIVEPNLLGSTVHFGLILSSKIISQIHSETLSDEIATWLVGTNISGTDCLLNILLENAIDDSSILLPILQLVDALLNSPNEQILNSMIFVYVNTRGYFDSTKARPTENSLSEPKQSCENENSSSNILKTVNKFLSLLPLDTSRETGSESIGTSYEDYIIDASRLYRQKRRQVANFHWQQSELMVPSEATNGECLEVVTTSSDDTFYEGPLLTLLFNHLENMEKQPYETNLASIAIISKLALLPHPLLHEILLCTDFPVKPGARTLFLVIESLSKHLLCEIQLVPNFMQKISETAKRLLSNPPLLGETIFEVENAEPLFEALIVLDEFVKELAAIIFVKHELTD